MKILGYNVSFAKASAQTNEQAEQMSDRQAVDTQSAMFYGDDTRSATPWVPIVSKSFNGEKTAGALGNPLNLVPDYISLRIRAHEANFTSDVIKIITGRFFNWVVGSGLKLQAEPNEEVLELEGIKEDLDAFRKNVEAYFPVYAGSTMADSADMQSLHELAADAYAAAFLGGDDLIVLRLDDDLNITVQVIDGQHVRTPFLNGLFIKEAKERGNTIIHGIEMDKKGTHVAFYVLTMTPENPIGEFERIEARGKTTGCLMAWVIYGKKQRIDHKRGIPQIAAIIEKVKKLDRYTEASVSSAEERAKVPWTIVHNKYSDGENPLAMNVKRNVPGAMSVNSPDSYEMAKASAKDISISEEKTVYNLPIGAEFKAVGSQSEVQYEPFFKAVFMQLCAAVDIPPEVALQQYNSNYSASRAAINGWGYIINIYRKKHGFDFYQKVYNLWLYVHVLKNKIRATGYVKAVNEKNRYVIESYSAARFTGANMPHIDPVKEANAVRIMLGDKTTPLMSYEQASEQLNNGEWSENIKKVEQERSVINELTPLPGAVDNTIDEPADPGDNKKPKKKKANAADSETKK